MWSCTFPTTQTTSPSTASTSKSNTEQVTKWHPSLSIDNLAESVLSPPCSFCFRCRRRTARSDSSTKLTRYEKVLKIPSWRHRREHFVTPMSSGNGQLQRAECLQSRQKIDWRGDWRRYVPALHHKSKSTFVSFSNVGELWFQASAKHRVFEEGIRECPS